ncbi:MAG TPA: PaaI family thioesterase [Negativicutes bacterium]|nr:PaaI family thioesterase [Negativicutes bacterium]
MTEENFSSLHKYFSDVYHQNVFVNLLDMKLVHIEPGLAELTMPVDPAKHTNLYKVAHGGALASVADTAMGVACASLGRRVVTLDLNMNFIKAADAGTEIRAVGRVAHNGRQTLVVECDVFGTDDVVLVKARGTFFVVGKFDLASNENNT